VFVQRLREGALRSKTEGYGGFWIRVLASMIDGVILAAVMIPIQIAMVVGATMGQDPTRIMIASLAANGIALGLGVGYETFFVVKYSATPGKMVCRLRVRTAEGGPLGWGRAVGRYFAKYISGLTLGIGFLVACVDEQKRTLHDHICSTRVVKRES
ncbi:MAG: RDD family protein, partial [Acidobacteria bacterium]|nr:RDD family protein [Acidobacteriota bacterium]